MTHGSKLLHHFWDKLRHLNGITALNTSPKMELKQETIFCSGWQMMSLRRTSSLFHVTANAKEVKLNPFSKNPFQNLFPAKIVLAMAKIKFRAGEKNGKANGKDIRY